MIVGVLVLLAAVPAQDTASKASESAQGFSLDLPASDAAPVADASPATEAEPASRTDHAAAASADPVPETASGDAPTAATGPIVPEVITMPAVLSLDTPIRELIADRRGRAVLDADMPGLSTDPNIGKFADISLRAFQPLTGGQLTDALMAKIAADFARPDALVAAADKRRKAEEALGR